MGVVIRFFGLILNLTILYFKSKKNLESDQMSEDNKVGKKIRQVRESKEISVEELAKPVETVWNL